MTPKQMHRILRPAKAKSKQGWPLVTGQVPPEVLERLNALADRRPAFRSDLIREAIEAFLEKEAA